MVCCMVEVLLQNTYARDVGDLNRLNEEEEMKRVLISIAILTMTTMTVNAESLFTGHLCFFQKGAVHSCLAIFHKTLAVCRFVLQNTVSLSYNLCLCSRRHTGLV